MFTDTGWRSYISPTTAGIIGLALTIIVIRFPDAAFEASVAGLQLWFDIVLPALLPFFVLSEILLGLGVIHAVGVMLEPLMRPLFRIPGVGAFTLAMGLASGYPLGAKLTGRLRREGLCTREEAERLVSFANTADPLFMVGAVAFGMFGSAALGITIAAAHYLAAFTVGFLLRYHAGGAMGPERPVPSRAILRRAITEMAMARRRDGRPIGSLFSDAVRDSMGSMIFIGGCIMIFSVFIRIMTVSGIAEIVTSALSFIVSPLRIDPAVLPAIVNGLMEITLGAQMASQAPGELLDRLVAASFVIGWSGFSVHAQVAAMLHGTDVRMAPYILARLVHGVLAALLTWVLYPLLGDTALQSTSAAALMYSVPYWQRLAVLGGSMGIALGALVILSGLIVAVRRVRITVFRVP